MAGTVERTLALKIIGDIKGLKKTQRGLGSFTKSMVSWGKALSGALVIGGIEKVVGGLGDAYAGFKSGERAAGQMRRAWKNLNLDGRKFKSTLDKVTDSTLRLGTSDDEAVQAFTRSLATTRDYGESLRRLTIAQDLVANGSAPNLDAAFRMIMMAGKGSARVVDRFGLSAETSAGRIRQLGNAVAGAAKEKARLAPLQVLFNRLAENAEDIVGSFVKGNFNGIVKGLQGLGKTIDDALFGKLHSSGRRDKGGLVDRFGSWGKKIGDGIAKGLGEVDWGKTLADTLNAGLTALQTAGQNSTLSTLAIIGTAIAGGIFAVDLFITAATTMFGLPAWGAKKIVAIGALVVGKLFAGAMFVASMFASVAGDMFGGIAAQVPSRLAAKSKGAGKSIGKITAAGFSTGFLGAIATGVFIAGIVNAVLDQLGVPEGGWPKPKVYNPATGQWEERATGGPVSRGKPYLVGERGPEMFVPGSSGGIVPNHRMGGMGGASYVINVNVAPGGDLVEAGRQMVRAIREYEKRGGALWRS